MNIITLSYIRKEVARMSLSKKKALHFSEMSFIEIAYEILGDQRKAMAFKDLLATVTKIQGLTEEQIDERISQYYTDVNVDGRFMSIDGKWGLKSWYPVDQIDEEVAVVPKVKKKKSKKAALDEEIIEDLIEEEEFDEFIEEIVEEEDDFDEDFEEDDIEEDLEEVIDAELDEVEVEVEEEEDPFEISLDEIEKEELADEEEEEM